MRRTCAPTAVALGVMVMVALVTGWSKSTCSHCPTADCSALDTQLVDESLSMAAVGAVAGATLGSAVESAAELDTEIRPPVQSPCTRAGVARRVVGHPVEGVPGVAFRADRRRVVVDAAVVGFAGQRGVGDGDDRCRKPGPLRVGGQQHRPERRLVDQPAALVESQQRFGSAVDAGHRVGVGEIRSAGRAAPSRLRDRSRRRGTSAAARCR